MGREYYINNPFAHDKSIHLGCDVVPFGYDGTKEQLNDIKKVREMQEFCHSKIEDYQRDIMKYVAYAPRTVDDLCASEELTTGLIDGIIEHQDILTRLYTIESALETGLRIEVSE